MQQRAGLITAITWRKKDSRYRGDNNMTVELSTLMLMMSGMSEDEDDRRTAASASDD